MPEPDFDDPGLLRTEELGLLTDRYELAMAASYLQRDMNDRAVFELFVRTLPPHRQWLLAAGVGPAVAQALAIRFSAEQRAYLRDDGFPEAFCEHLARWRFTGDIDAVPEGTVVFAGEPLVRVTAPRIDAQILETLLLNQIGFQTAVATKAARVVLAAGAGPDQGTGGGAVVDFSARRDHGIDAAIKAARSCAIAGVAATSNVAAAHRYGLRSVGTMAHAYVQSFDSERDSFEAFLRDFPDNAVLLVDTYDTLRGVRRAVEVAQDIGVGLQAVRLDSGDLGELARKSREILDAAGLEATQIIASGDLDEHRIAELRSQRAPIDLWGVGTEMGTSRDSPTLSAVYKLVADERPDGAWRPVAKSSEDKATVPCPKQVHRRYEHGRMHGDRVVAAGEAAEGSALLVPIVRDGRRVHREAREQVTQRAQDQLGALPAHLQLPDPDAEVQPYPVTFSTRLLEAQREAAPVSPNGGR